MCDQPAQDTIPRCAQCGRPTTEAGRHLVNGLVACPPSTPADVREAARVHAEAAGEWWIMMPGRRSVTGTPTVFGPYGEVEARQNLAAVLPALLAHDPPKLLRVVEDYDISGDVVRGALQQLDGTADGR